MKGGGYLNTMLNQVGGVESTVPVKQSQKTKSTSTNEFRDMLSATINAEKPQASQKENTGNKTKTDGTGKPSDEKQTTVKPGTPEEKADKEITDETAQAMAAMQTNMAGNANQTDTETEPEAENTDFLKAEAAQVGPVKLQAMAQQTAPVQTAITQTETVDTANVQVNPTASAQADSVNTVTAQTAPANTDATQESTVSATAASETQQTGTQVQTPVTQTAVQAEAQQKAEAAVTQEQEAVGTQTTQPQANVQQTGTAAEQAAKPVQAVANGEVEADTSAKVTETAPEQVTVSRTNQTENQTKTQEKPIEVRVENTGHQAETVKPENQEKTAQVPANSGQAAETAKPQTDGARTRFDDMIAKASQELAQGEEVEAEEVVDTKPVVGTENTEEPETVINTAKQEIPAKTEEKQDTRPAAVVRSEPVAPKSAPRTVREASGTDEATIGLIQPKQEVFTPETIKIQSEPAPAQPLRAPDQAEQIKAEVIRNIEENKMEFNMQLNPKELGKIDVKMVLQGGSLSVEIITANAQATELLSKQAESLVATLKTGNLEVSSVTVVHEAQNASGNMEGQFNLNNFQDRQQAHEQRGHAGRGTHGGNAQEPENTAQEGDARSAPQGKLNYSI